MKQKNPEMSETAVVHVDPATENGVYANVANVIHSPNEFLLDFIMALPGGRRKLTARVILSPAHAKTLAAALVQNVAKYEGTYGEIDTGRHVKDDGFSGTVN